MKTRLHANNGYRLRNQQCIAQWKHSTEYQYVYMYSIQPTYTGTNCLHWCRTTSMKAVSSSISSQQTLPKYYSPGNCWTRWWALTRGATVDLSLFSCRLQICLLSVSPLFSLWAKKLIVFNIPHSLVSYEMKTALMLVYIEVWLELTERRWQQTVSRCFANWTMISVTFPRTNSGVDSKDLPLSLRYLLSRLWRIVPVSFFF